MFTAFSVGLTVHAAEESAGCQKMKNFLDRESVDFTQKLICSIW
jgi:hypothetical protein